MNLAVAPSSHWQISTRPTGEVLTARISAEDVDLVVLGIPSGFTPDEVEGWLRDLLGVARETSRNDAGERPIPGLLHHILTGLLFSHAELWDRAGGTLACSCVFLRTGREVAFGWVGDRDPEVWIRGQRLEVEWVRVRDDEGREARAFAIDAVHPLELKLIWPNELEMEAEGRSVELTARWTARVEAPAAAVTPADTLAPASQPSDSVFTMARLSTTGHVPSDAAPGAPLGIEPRESIEPEVASEVQSPSWPPPLEEAPPLPESLPQDAPGLSFMPPALDPAPPVTVTPAAARWEELARMMNAPAPPAPESETDAPVLAIPQVPSAPRVDVAKPSEPAPPPVAYTPPPEPTPVAYAPPAAPPVEVVPVAEVAHVEADDPAWDLESGVEAQPYETPQPTAEHEAPAASQSGDWSVVYEGDGSGAATGASRGKGLFGWVSGLLKRKDPKAVMPVPTFEEAAYVEDEPTYEAPVAPAYVEPRPPVLPAIEVPVARVEVVAPPPVARVVEPVAPPPPPVARIEPVAPPPLPIARVEPVVPPPPRLVVPPVARVTPTRLDVPVVAPPVASVADPIVVEPVGAPAPATPRAPTTVSRAVAASSAADREEAPVPWLDEQPPSPRARAASRAARPPRVASEYGPTPLWKKPWPWVVVLVALFAGGWLVGALQDDGTHKNGPGPMQRMLRGMGLGGARYEVTINSRPPGAWIAVGGKDLARRTPATIDLTPGEHPVTLSFADLGAATYTVRGERGDKVALDAALWGSLSVRGSDMSMPIAVSVDGKSLGFAPIQLDSLSPGPHEVRFSGPGMPSWSQTVTVKVGEASDVLARPMTSPATGMIDVRASIAGNVGSEGINGAAVYIDGVRRGSTPFTLELPRGPHSIRVEHQSETAPVQVIDLPGGNQRFATFEFGLDIERPTMTALAPPARIPMDKPAVISASLLGVGATEVREMWLHVRTPDETWRRYQMVMMKATGGVVGVAVFPPTMFDSEGNARWYVSASTTTGDDYFTELQTSQLQAPAASSRR